MAKQTVSRTALGAAICRMIEQYQPLKSRLFDDPVAKELVGWPIRLMMQSGAMRKLTVQQTDAVAKGIYGAQVCRTRYIDEVVQSAISQGISQLVIMGAGYDTRPYRLPELTSVRVFEIDLPAVQADKKKKLQKYLGHLPDRVTFIPMDFDTQGLETVLSGTAFEAAKPAIFLWEGVTQYISEEAVRRTLGFVGKLAPGSSLVFTYVLKSIIERRSDIPDADHMMDVVAKQSPWIFGMEPSGVSDFLKQYDLTLAADVGNADYQERYLKPRERSLAVFEGERIVQATVGGGPD
ncbi:MAG TPA: class I SAM-dependent methyltransferase [Anaerolineales bacterium]|nr:class I SAM-dependent methyltransferase [Anaerolineales bacterium]